MSFEGRIVAPNNVPPARLYVHASNFSDVFVTMEDAAGYASQALKAIPEREKESTDFILGAIWGNQTSLGDGTFLKKKVADLFLYKGIQKKIGDLDTWKHNPEVSAYIIEEGIANVKNPMTCGETIRVLGQEEEYRMLTRNIREYMEMPPKIHGIPFMRNQVLEI